VDKELLTLSRKVDECCAPAVRPPGAGVQQPQTEKQGRAVQLQPYQTHVESAWNEQRSVLRLKYDDLLSSFAFKLKLRRYSTMMAEGCRMCRTHLHLVGTRGLMDSARYVTGCRLNSGKGGFKSLCDDVARGYP
jgi:hypothetical protein